MAAPLALAPPGTAGEEAFFVGSPALKKTGWLPFLCGFKFLFAGPAFRADPILRQILERRAGFNAVIRISGCRIVNVTAQCTSVFDHYSCLRKKNSVYFTSRYPLLITRISTQQGLAHLRLYYTTSNHNPHLI